MMVTFRSYKAFLHNSMKSAEYEGRERTVAVNQRRNEQVPFGVDKASVFRDDCYVDKMYRKAAPSSLNLLPQH